jgi:hypothetical protein
MYIYLSRAGKDLPISSVKIGWGEGICINDNVQDLDSSRSEDYPLNNPQAEFCTTDQRYQLITSDFEERIYRTNNVLEKIKFSRPSYPISANVRVGLYMSSFV